MTIKLSDLPKEVADVIGPYDSATPVMLEAIGQAIAGHRDEAVAARKASGIEDVWQECEESYVGIDDANRHEWTGASWAKPLSMDGPVTTGKTQKNPSTKSTVFIRLTARYVDAGSAKLGEILLPPDDKAFSFSEMPVPELIKAKTDKSHVVHDGLGNAPLMRPARPHEMPAQPASAPSPLAPGAAAAPPAPQAAQAGAPAAGAVPAAGAAGPGQPPLVPLTVKDLAEEAIEIARKKAKAAEEKVYGWMVESQYTAESRKVIFDSSRIGVGVLKGPFPKSKRAMVLNKNGDAAEFIIRDKIFPGVRWVDPWNCFPDPTCGEDIHNGDFFLERDFLSERQLRKLKDEPGYIATQIDKVIKQGPDKSGDLESVDNTKSDPSKAGRKGRYQVWYWYGALKKDDITCLYAAGGENSDRAAELATISGGSDMVYCIVTLINDSAIKAVLNPLDSGEFPYHVMPWQRRAGHWAGIGVGEQVRVPQRMINAGTRSTLNNAGVASGSQIVINRSLVSPADGNWNITPDKIWYGSAEIEDVRAAFATFEIPNTTDQLMKIINYALQMAEESTSIPLITQGQSGATTPDTFGAAQLQNNNANQLLRSVGYSYDDNVTEPLVRQYYQYWLMDPDIAEEEKGEFEINAHGSIALVERAIMDQTIAQMGNVALNPAYGIDPKRWAKQFLKSKRLNAEDFQYTPEEQQRMDQNPVKPIQVQVAEANAASREKIAQSDLQVETQRINNQHTEAAAQASVDLHELALKRELAMLEYANREKVNLDQVKADLSKTVMTLNTQKQLNAADNAMDLHKHHNPQKPQKPNAKTAARPLAQAPGKAGNGKAFSQAQ